MTVKYLVRIDDRPDSKTYMKPQSLHRITKDDDGMHFHRWTGDEWVDNPNLIRHTGIGGDEDYQTISEAKARKLMI